MKAADLIALAVAAIGLANQLRLLAMEETDKDETLTPEQKQQFLARISAAQNSVTKIE